MTNNISKVTPAPLPCEEAPARLGYCVLSNKECSDSEFFPAGVMMVKKIQNLNLFAHAIHRAQHDSLMIDSVSPLPGRGKIQILNFSSTSQLQGENSESEFSCEAELSGGVEAPALYPEYWTSVRTKMRELKM